MAKVKITVRNHGPFRVEDPEGEVELVDHEGNVLDLSARRPVFALCRCAASSSKPFCDGKHKECGPERF